MPRSSGEESDEVEVVSVSGAKAVVGALDGSIDRTGVSLGGAGTVCEGVEVGVAVILKEKERLARSRRKGNASKTSTNRSTAIRNRKPLKVSRIPPFERRRPTHSVDRFPFSSEDVGSIASLFHLHTELPPRVLSIPC